MRSEPRPAPRATLARRHFGESLRLVPLIVLAALVASCAGQPPTPPGAPDLDLATRPAVPGIDRTTIRDDAGVAVTRVRFAPGAAEPVHSHPFELMIVALMPGQVTWTVADRTVAFLETGTVQFVPAGVLHQLANAGSEPFEIIAVALK